MLNVIGVSKKFETKVVLDAVSLAFEEGRTHVIVGSSGSGKTTLLRVIMGLIACDAGRIELEDASPERCSQKQWASYFGYVPQEGGLFPHLTARDNVSLVARTLGWKEEQIAARIAELLPLVSLDESILEKFPRQLSGGQKQRVAIMRASFLNPRLLVFDEPLGALDPLIRSDLQREFREIFQRLKKTVILITHDLAEAAFFGDQVTLMHEGRVVQTGVFQDLLTAPANSFVTKFISAQRGLGLSGGTP
jgi:osmoprotectant transport system ATP-binding protein